MGYRRHNYTGSDNEQLIRKSVAAESEDRPHNPLPPNPMMLINESMRLWQHLVEDGAPTQFMQNSSRVILRELGHKSGIFQLDLSKATHLKPPTISVALQKMETEGLVTRIVDDADMRATRVYLTEKGRELNDQVRDRLVNADNVALSGFSEDEQEQLMSLLIRIRNNLAENVKK